MVSLRGRLYLALLATALGATAAASAAGRGAARRDVEGYAVASCLTAQKSPFLKDQGDGWAANIVQRDTFDLALFGKLAAAVRAEVSRGNMASIIVEQPPMTVKQLPIQYCAEIIDTPRVRAAIDTTLAGMSRKRRGK